jgi:hypothetical protein
MPGKDLEQRYGAELAGAFSDEIDIRHPFKYLNSQCFATSKPGRRPTTGTSREMMALPARRSNIRG